MGKRRKELAVIARVPHTCPVCKGGNPHCTACDGVGQWDIRMFENPPAPPKPNTGEYEGSEKAFAMRQARRLG